MMALMEVEDSVLCVANMCILDDTQKFINAILKVAHLLWCGNVQYVVKNFQREVKCNIIER